jgi:hypothetical protein
MPRGNFVFAAALVGAAESAISAITTGDMNASAASIIVVIFIFSSPIYKLFY